MDSSVANANRGSHAASAYQVVKPTDTTTTTTDATGVNVRYGHVASGSHAATTHAEVLSLRPPHVQLWDHKLSRTAHMFGNIDRMIDQGPSNADTKILSTKVIATGFAVLITVTIGSLLVLVSLYPPADGRAASDLIRTSANLGFGSGGVAALLLTARRQQSTEETNAKTQQLTEQSNLHAWHDAKERRITELQSKAGEQLASDKPVVRQNALYQLERLANEDASHEQTVANIICGYLRMPWPDSPPSDSPRLSNDTPNEAHSGSYKEAEEERQVRLTAQRILASNLRRDATRPWEKTKEIDIDLTGANLINLDFSLCNLGSVRFDNALLQGATRFDEAVFHKHASFKHSRFTEEHDHAAATSDNETSFRETRFHDGANFSSATFEGDAQFEDLLVKNIAAFTDSMFYGAVFFKRAEFHGDAQFIHSWMRCVAHFQEAKFHGRTTSFDYSRLINNIDLHKSEFDCLADFIGVKFEGGGNFAGSIFRRRADFNRATLAMGDFNFKGAVFDDEFVFHKIDNYGSKIIFDEALVRQDTDLNWSVLPEGWTLRQAPEDSINSEYLEFIREG